MTAMNIMQFHGDNTSSWDYYTHLIGKYRPIVCTIPWIYRRIYRTTTNSIEKHTVPLLMTNALPLKAIYKPLSTTITASINKRIKEYSDYVPAVGSALIYSLSGIKASSLSILFSFFYYRNSYTSNNLLFTTLYYYPSIFLLLLLPPYPPQAKR